jgi:hypothetical protein
MPTTEKTMRTTQYAVQVIDRAMIGGEKIDEDATWLIGPYQLEVDADVAAQTIRDFYAREELDGYQINVKPLLNNIDDYK